MSKHTPGPWDIIDQYIIAGDESVICQWESYTKKADARLIAAAPDLLAACKRMIAQAADRNMPLTKEKVLQFVVIHEEMRAAIAKAEGVS